MSAITQKASKEDWGKFTIVMIVFIIGMIVMMLYKIENIWLWIGYVALWTWVEMVVAKNIHLKWWVWLLIIFGLCIIDIIIIYTLPH
ncbi:MAG: hypothetical protein AAF611_15430 [Bacteroidota bacterium]